MMDICIREPFIVAGRYISLIITRTVNSGLYLLPSIAGTNVDKEEITPFLQFRHSSQMLLDNVDIIIWSLYVIGLVRK